MNKNSLQKSIVVVFLLLATCTLSAAQPLSSQAIDALVERSMKTFDVPGISVGIIKDGQIIYAKGHGVRSLNTMQKMDENTLVGIASNSKAFTTAALGMLVDEGKIKWDDKVRAKEDPINWLPTTMVKVKGGTFKMGCSLKLETTGCAATAESGTQGIDRDTLNSRRRRILLSI